MGHPRGAALAAALALACGAVAAPAALAQQAAPAAEPPRAETGAGTAQQLNPARQTEAVSHRRAGDVFSRPESEPCPESSSPLSFTLQSVELAGSSTLTPDEVRNAYSDMVGKPIPVPAICEIRDRVAVMLFRHGVLARVVIPPQRIADGRLTLTVYEARIVSVHFSSQDDVGPVQAKVEGYLNHLRGLTPFNLDTAQHYLLLANDIPGVRVTAAMRPSANAASDEGRGAVDLDVTISRRPEDVIVAVQNTSSKSLGPWSAIGRVDLNSFTRFGERTTLIAYSTPSDEQQVVQMLEEARFGGSGLTARASFAYGRSRPGDALAVLDLHGKSIIGTVELDYPVIRLRRQNLTVGGGMDFIYQRTDFPGGGVLTDDSLRVFWLRAEASAQHPFFQPVLGSFATVSGDLTLEVRKGIDGLGASKAGEPTLSRNEGVPDATVVRADGQAGIRFDPIGPGLPMALSLRFQGQWADKPLLAYEEQPVGNLTIGRGYDPDAISGDRAIAGEARLQFGPWALGKRFSIAPYGFYDVAHISNLDQGSLDRTVRSVGGGAEVRLPYGLRFDIAYAKPLDKPFAASQFKPPSRVLVQIVFAY